MEQPGHRSTTFVRAVGLRVRLQLVPKNSLQCQIHTVDRKAHRLLPSSMGLRKPYKIIKESSIDQFFFKQPNMAQYFSSRGSYAEEGGQGIDPDQQSKERDNQAGLSV